MRRNACLIQITFVLAFAGPLARADLGTLQSGDALALPEIEEPASSTPVKSSPADTVVATTIPEPPKETMNRPWAYRTVAGPTAFVLDARQFEVEMLFTRFSDLLSDFSLPRPFADIKYGLNDALTLELAMSQGTVQAGVKDNVLNLGEWSFALSPSVAFEFSKSGTSSLQGLPWIAELAASRVIGPKHRLHLGLQAGSVQSAYHYNGSYGYMVNGTWQENSYSYGASTSGIAFRLSASFEFRHGQRHGLVFWVAPALMLRQQASEYNGDVSSGLDRASLLLEGGVGYQLNYERFSFTAGVGAGPRFSSYGNIDVFGYGNYVDGFGAFTGGLSYRI